MVYGKLVGPKGKLFIFEPYRVSNKIVTKNVYLNDLEEITTVYRMAASNKKSKGYIFVNTGNTGGSAIYTDESLAVASEADKNILKNWRK